MTSRERLAAILNHQAPDQLCVDFGAGLQTGMGVSAVHRLRRAVLGQPDFRVKVIEPYQMLGEIDEELRLALGLDAVGVHGPGTMFGFKNEGWKPFTLFRSAAQNPNAPSPMASFGPDSKPRRFKSSRISRHEALLSR